ncbi:MAG: SycD/LcrH family type III secretion system chaperone [Gammaproteobacteria bacterium]
MQINSRRALDEIAQDVATYLFAGGTVAGLYGTTDEDLEAVYALGYNLYNQSRWAEALRVFSFLAMQNHVERRFHVGRGACLLMLKRHEEALRAFGLAHLLDVSDPAVALQFAECLIALRRKDDARVALQTVAALAADEEAYRPIRSRAAALSTLLQGQ